MCRPPDDDVLRPGGVRRGLLRDERADPAHLSCPISRKRNKSRIERYLAAWRPREQRAHQLRRAQDGSGLYSLSANPGTGSHHGEGGIAPRCRRGREVDRRFLSGSSVRRTGALFLSQPPLSSRQAPPWSGETCWRCRIGCRLLPRPWRSPGCGNCIPISAKSVWHPRFLPRPRHDIPWNNPSLRRSSGVWWPPRKQSRALRAIITRRFSGGSTMSWNGILNDRCIYLKSALRFTSRSVLSAEPATSILVSVQSNICNCDECI